MELVTPQLLELVIRFIPELVVTLAFMGFFAWYTRRQDTKDRDHTALWLGFVEKQNVAFRETVTSVTREIENLANINSAMNQLLIAHDTRAEQFIAEYRSDRNGKYEKR